MHDDPATYGESFAEVYDDWYSDVSDVDGAVRCIATLAGPGGRVLELGIGTGRIALPLAAAGVEVHGIDASPSMLTLLAEKPGATDVRAYLGDMAKLDAIAGLAGPFDLAFVAFNTLFNLPTAETQQACIGAVANLLAPAGRFIVEAFVPADGMDATIETRSEKRGDGHGGSVLTTTTHDATAQTVVGNHAHTRADGTIVDRPWSIRYSTPAQLDAWCAAAGLERRDRWEDWHGTPLSPTAGRHVSVYRRA